MQRDRLKSRLGFILLSAGCAVGIGNVWRFPYVVGQNGGAIFVFMYLICLVLIGVPILALELSIGRGSQKSVVKAYDELEPKGSKWHLHGIFSLIGNYIVMMFYTVISGWMLYYFYSFITGKFSTINSNEVSGVYDDMLSNPLTLFFWSTIVIVIGVGVCSFGLKKGVEKSSKFMMTSLLVIISFLAIYSITLPGASAGLEFYLRVDFSVLSDGHFFNILVAAINQAFFTLGVGIGSMLIFGSFIDKEKSLLGESLTIGFVDSFIAIVAGFIIFPACFAFGVSPDSGPGLIFITLPNVFISMPYGNIVGTFFFLFMSFAALSTVIALVENIINMCQEKYNISRIKACITNFILLTIISLPAILGYNILSDIQPLGANTTILDGLDWIASYILFPLGSLIILLFCTNKRGWGYKNFEKECNSGTGLKLPKFSSYYLTYILPIIILLILIKGIFF